jgi:hypothetical protein
LSRSYRAVKYVFISCQETKNKVLGREKFSGNGANLAKIREIVSASLDLGKILMLLGFEDFSKINNLLPISRHQG